MKREHRVLDFIGAWLGVFEVDWDSDFEDDGYTDILGRDVDEEFFFSDNAKKEHEIESGNIHTA